MWGLLYGTSTVQTNCWFRSASVFFLHFLFSCHHSPPSNSQNHHYPIFLQRSEAAQCNWESNSPAEVPPSLWTPGKGDSLKGTKICQTRFNSWNFSGHFLLKIQHNSNRVCFLSNSTFDSTLEDSEFNLLTWVSPVRTSVCPSFA